MDENLPRTDPPWLDSTDLRIGKLRQWMPADTSAPRRNVRDHICQPAVLTAKSASAITIDTMPMTHDFIW